MSFSVSGKLRCWVDVHFKSLHKVYVYEEVKLTLDKVRS